ncbi:MAG: NADH/ubiquinone/plastoquinone (complex I) [Candidatus Omnitrophica bacterium]|nr:NADH/ubiquinone/plastoquinone (complex I) [Candidatus Omnitrophota bacterium]MBU1924247.1 NADH/ubiquinone/plastoquinone (complex I) [Candidatus Omnitrophota bacterium]
MILPFFVIIPLGAAFLISFFGKRIKNFADLLANLGTLSLLVFSLYSISLVATHKILVYKVGGWVPPMGICMVLDGLASFMLVMVNLVSFLVALYSISYMQRYTDKPKFYTLFMLMLAGMNGIIVSGDLFNLFVFLEIASIASYALVAFGTEAEELEASFKYAVMGSVASSFILLGIALLYGYTSTLNMADISLVLFSKPSSMIVKFIGVLFLAGFGLKAALVPFHAWLPDAHPSAPASISAMLSGVLIKVLGVYAIIRIFFNLIGINKVTLSILMFLGAVSMLVGVILALSQWDFKRLLAYHSISQIGYVILGIGLGTPLGILGGLFHLFNHSIFKSLLFLNSGAVVYSLGTRDLRKMGGLQEKMPVTSNTNLVASMSIAGIPPFNGFFSKFIIIVACIQAEHFGYAFCAVIGSILTLASFMKVQKYAFFGKLNQKWQNIKEVPWTMWLSMIVLAIICVVGGLLIIPLFRPFLQSAVNVLLLGTGYKEAVFAALR